MQAFEAHAKPDIRFQTEQITERSKANFELQIASRLSKPKCTITQCTSRMGHKNRSRILDQLSKTNPEKLNNSEPHEVQNHKLEPKSRAKQVQ